MTSFDPTEPAGEFINALIHEMQEGGTDSLRLMFPVLNKSGGEATLELFVQVVEIHHGEVTKPPTLN